MWTLKIIRNSFVLSLAAIGICSGSASAQLSPPQGPDIDKLRKDCPDLDADSLEELANVKPGSQAFGFTYAHMFCVPLAEARRRMQLQTQNMALVQSVIGEIIKYESDSYVNHWQRHKPDYRLIVEFTQNAEATLSKYTDDPYFLAINRPGANKQDKDRKSQELLSLLQKWNISFGSAGFDYKTGKYDIRLAGDYETDIRQKAADNHFIIPNWVVFTPPSPFPHEVPIAISPERVKAFPRYKERRDVYMQTAVGVRDTLGTLRLKKGCLVIRTDSGDTTALWAKYYAADLSRTDKVGVFSQKSGTSVYVGQDVVISGLQPGPARNVHHRNGKPYLWSEVADDTDGPCLPPYMQIDHISLKTDYDAQKLENKIKELMLSQGLSKAQAQAEAQRQRQRGTEIQNLIESLKQTHKDSIAGGYGSFDGFVAPSNSLGYLPAYLLIKKGAKDTDMIPAHLREFINIQTVPRSLAEGERDVAFLKEQLGTDAQVDFFPGDGKVHIEAVTDLKHLSRLLVDMGDDWPKHFELKIGANAFAPEFEMPEPEIAIEMRKTQAYQRLYEWAEERHADQGFNRLDRAVLTTLNYGFSAVDVEGLEAQDLGPISALIGYGSQARKQKDEIFSDVIVTAEFIDHDGSDHLGDGFRSTTRFKILEVLKGETKLGQVLKVRARSGDDESGNYVKAHNEPFMLPGFTSGFAGHKKWRLYLSGRAYKEQNQMTNTRNEDLNFYVLSGKAMPLK